MAGIETITRADIAQMLGLSQEYVTDDLTKRPGFPKPVIKLSQRNVRYALRDVLDWIKRETARRV